MSGIGRHSFGADEVRALQSLVITIAIMGVLLVVPAGTIEWQRAWWFLALFVVSMLAAVAYIWRSDPELFVVRRKPQPGTKSWDIPFVVLTVTSITATLPVAGLDYRFNWLQLPDGLVWFGYLAFVASFCLTAWAQGVNRHFELTVRIQTDREHKVIDTGPYSIIRHPGYIGATGLAIGMALALGSGVALLPALICMVGLLLRTLAEERTLADELPGYADYMRRVRFRWLPGVW